MRSLQFLIVIVLCLFSKPSEAQILDNRVSLQFQNVRLATILTHIRTRYQVGFSYANSLIPLDKKLTVDVKDKPLGEALNQLFTGTGISYTLIGKQIVLKKEVPQAPKVKTNRKPAQTLKQSRPSESPSTGKNTDDGWLKNEALPEEATASLLPIPSLSPEKPDGSPKDAMELQKEYQSEQRTLLKNYVSQMDAAMDANDSLMTKQVKSEFRRLRSKLKKEFRSMRSELGRVHWDSLFRFRKNDSLYKPEPVQVSFVPPLSTNGKANQYSVNKLSFNILAGYSGGLNGVELGGIANIERDDVRGVQVSGVANLVKQDVNGVQVAGYFNAHGGHLEGVQVSGFLNLSGSDSSSAVQVAGFGNLHRGDLVGAQVSGTMNVNGGYLIGPQVAGFMNLSKGPVAGAQVAGFTNLNTGNLTGAQVAGFLNLTRKNSNGTQVAGFMNLTGKDVQGVQVAGFINLARRVRGSQIGVFNFADSVSGIQFGFFNFARKGYRRLEVFGSEHIQANLAFKMGSRKFYNVFLVGINPLETSPRWSYGYGFGSEFRLGKKVDLNLDLICNQIQENTKSWTENLNLINQVKLNLGVHPGNRTSLFAGPTLNVAVSRVRNTETGEIGSGLIAGWSSFDQTYGKTRVAIWPGFNAGIRF